MNLHDILRILKRNILIIAGFPAILAALVWTFTKAEEKKYSSSFMIYTGIASGFHLTSEENPRFDHNVVNNAFDNLINTLKARENIEEVALRLLASHLMLDSANEAYMSKENFQVLKEAIPDTLWKKLRQKDLSATVMKLYEYRYSPRENVVKSLLDSDSDIYGTEYIRNNVSAYRKETSDMLEVWYFSSDAAVCQNTLQILAEVFIRRYNNIKEGEISNVIAYFSDQMAKSQARLKQAEDSLKAVEKLHKIVNYDEQAKHLTHARQNYIEEIQKENMTIASAEATVRNLDQRLNMRKGLMQANDRIVEKREELARINYKIANNKVYGSDENELRKNQAAAESLKTEIREIVSELYKIHNSQEGLPADNLLAQWLTNVLLIDECNARIKILEKRLEEFEDEYKAFAPLNTIMNRLKREISVAEKDYLAHLHALNVNKQRQQNIKLTSHIKLVDKPYYPLKPEDSKSHRLVGLAVMSGLILTLSFFIGREFLDNSIKTPDRAEKLTGMKAAGALPLCSRKSRGDMAYLESGMLEQAITAMLLELNRKSNQKPILIMLSSTRSGDGKTWCSIKLAKKLNKIRGPVLFLYPSQGTKTESISEEKFVVDISELDMHGYEAGKDFVETREMADLAKGKNLNSYNYIIIEIPSLVEHQMPLELVKKTNLNLLVVPADRTWSEADAIVTSMYEKASTTKPMLLLNRMTTDRLEQVFGKLPRRYARRDKENAKLSRNIKKQKSVRI